MQDTDAQFPSFQTIGFGRYTDFKPLATGGSAMATPRMPVLTAEGAEVASPVSPESPESPDRADGLAVAEEGERLYLPVVIRK